MDIFFIILGLLFIIGSMVLFLNPPEAWVKKAFLRSSRRPARTKGSAGEDAKRDDKL